MQTMELFTEWPSMVISLEYLRPLSPEIFDHETKKIAADVDKLSRSQRAGKILDHFDELQQEESEPFDWFSNERSVDIPIFENLPSPPLDLRPPLQPTYVFPTSAHTLNINAEDYQQQQQQQQRLQEQSTLPSNAYDSLSSAVLYSPPPQHLRSPPPVVPVAQPSPPLVIPATSSAEGAFNNSHVKAECDPLVSSASSLFASPDYSSVWLKPEALTPPDSPKDEEILKMLEEIEPEALERLVMARAEELDPQTPTFAEEISSCASPDAYSDNGDSCLSNYSRSGSVSPLAMSDSSLDDPEWTPSRNVRESHLARGNNNNKRNNNNNINIISSAVPASGTPAAVTTTTTTTTAAASRRRVSKPYSKPGVEERRQRKKEQNKNAATRYRMKKKAEVEEVKVEELQLIEHNTELKKQLEDICREVRYLKSLMREVYKKKGLIK